MFGLTLFSLRPSHKTRAISFVCQYHELFFLLQGVYHVYFRLIGLTLYQQTMKSHIRVTLCVFALC